MKRAYLSILIALVILLAGCGKKTDPVEKSKFNIPTPEESVVYNTAKGVGFKNPSRKYALRVYRAQPLADGNGCGKYFLKATVSPGEKYLDTGVKNGQKLFYKAEFIDMEYNIQGAYLLKTQIYSVPEQITETSFEEEGDDFVVTIKSIPGNGSFEIYHEDTVIGRTARGLVKISREKVKTGEISITALDSFGNVGDKKNLVLFRVGKEIPVPFGLEIVQAGTGNMITWKEPKGVNSYKIYAENGKDLLGETVAPYFKPESEKCGIYKIRSVSDGFESKSAAIKFCP